MVKSTNYSSRRRGFDFQHPNGSSHLSVTSFPWDPVPLSGLCRHWAHRSHRHRPNIHIHYSNSSNNNKISSQIIYLTNMYWPNHTGTSLDPRQTVVNKVNSLTGGAVGEKEVQFWGSSCQSIASQVGSVSTSRGPLRKEHSEVPL